MGRLGYYNEDLLNQHEAEAKRRYALQKEVMDKWKADAKAIMAEDESMLQKEARREAVTIIEDAARTEDEYDRVTILWDCLATMEKWRLAKSEPKRTNILTENEFLNSSRIIPPPINHAWWRQLIKGEFLDVIYDCPHEIQELSASRPVYFLTDKWDEKQKEIFYYWVIRLWTPQRIAAMREQTDRNIRKAYNKMIVDIQHEIYKRLYLRYRLYWNLTVTQVAFIEWYIEKHGAGKIRAELSEEVKKALRRVEYEPYISENASILGEVQCICVPAGERWQLIHHACEKSPAHCIRPDEGSRNSCSGSSERRAACDEAGRGERVTECHHAVCIEIRPFGIYACYTHNT